MLRAAWWLISLPFRIVAWVVVQLGRIAAVLVGFILMVLGVALVLGRSTFSESRSSSSASY